MALMLLKVAFPDTPKVPPTVVLENVAFPAFSCPNVETPDTPKVPATFALVRPANPVEVIFENVAFPDTPSAPIVVMFPFESMYVLLFIFKVPVDEMFPREDVPDTPKVPATV